MTVSTPCVSVVASARLAALTRLLQLASQALPTGAFAYSTGLESLLNLGVLRDEDDCKEYLCSLLSSSVVSLELPRFLLMMDAIADDKPAEVVRQSRLLMAARETRELQEQEAQMGRALCRVLDELRPALYRGIHPPETCMEGLAWASFWFGLSRDEACVLLVYNWIEQQVSALCRLLPLGPLAGQRLLDAVLLQVPVAIELAQQVPQEEIGSGSPGLALASALHEAQYCRIFRS